MNFESQQKCDGEQAARIGGMDRQTLRDWVHCFNEGGPDGLKDIRSKVHPPRLSIYQLAALASIFGVLVSGIFDESDIEASLPKVIEVQRSDWASWWQGRCSYEQRSCAFITHPILAA